LTSQNCGQSPDAQKTVVQELKHKTEWIISLGMDREANSERRLQHWIEDQRPISLD
jgi:hypothetical protein